MTNAAQNSVEKSMQPCNLFIQMSGAPGSGKSTIATLLQRSIGGLVIDHDIIRSSLLEDSEINFDQTAKKSYRLQWAWAEEVIKQGHNVIIDSPCNYEEALNQGRMIAARHNYKYWYIECRVENINLLDKRLRNRDPMRSQRTAVDCLPGNTRNTCHREISITPSRSWLKTPCRPESNVIVVDSTSISEKVRDEILEQISPQAEMPASNAGRFSDDGLCQPSS